MNIELQDSFELNGTNPDDFYKVLEEVDKITGFQAITTKQLEVLSVDPEHSDTKIIEATRFLANGIPKKVRIDVEKMFPNVSEKIINETINKNRIMLMYLNPKNGKRYAVFAGEKVLQTAGLRVGLGGDRILTPTIMRDAYFTESFRDLDKEVTLITRRSDGVVKAFAILSARYKDVPQTLIKTIISCFADDLGKEDVKYWNFSHDKSEIYIEFPEKAEDFNQVYNLPDKIIPGIRLSTSDTGFSSVTAAETWRLVNSQGVSEHHIYRKIHKGVFDPLIIVEHIESEIFDKYKKLPERLCDLLTIDVDNPENAIEIVLKEIGAKKILGLKNYDVVKDALESDFEGRNNVTAYEIALAVMNLPTRCANLKQYILLNLTTACGQAPYIDFEGLNDISSLKTTDSDEDEEITEDGKQLALEAY